MTASLDVCSYIITQMKPDLALDLALALGFDLDLDLLPPSGRTPTVLIVKQLLCAL